MDELVAPPAGQARAADLPLVPASEFDRVRSAGLAWEDTLRLIADLCRVNVLTSVELAGSGHLGSSLSCLDLVTFLYHSEMNTARLGPADADRDVYFSSKGHDAPALYAVLCSLGILPDGALRRLRRRDGPCGHPDVATPGVEANTGSLGMGLSKGKGMALAKRLLGRGGRVFVLSGDGELQEGQIYEALQGAAQQGLSSLHLLVDHNKVQSDRLVQEIGDLGDLEARLRVFGWHVARCDGHDYRQLRAVFREFASVADRPKALIADTIKGRGVSFMEHPRALPADGGLYRWHAGAPGADAHGRAVEELLASLNARLAGRGLAPVRAQAVPRPATAAAPAATESIVEAYGQALVELGRRHPQLVVLDADLAADCGLRGFEAAFPERLFECGIAEQDMVSTAGGMARLGLLPVVNSFGAFLSARANEQIFNNGTERTRVIYTCHYSGLLPAGAGHTHQGVRDLSLLASLPDLVAVQPCSALETRLALEFLVEESPGSALLRLNLGTAPRIELPGDHRLVMGRGAVLTPGSDCLLFSHGPVMLAQCLAAARLLAARGMRLGVVGMPWLNRVDDEWLDETVRPVEALFVAEDHLARGGLADVLLDAAARRGLLAGRRFGRFGLHDYPVWGTPDEVLWHHGLDGEHLAEAIWNALCREGGEP